MLNSKQNNGPQLTAEERRSLRAKRNRESAEKSRVRRKEQTAELEMSVAELRDENKSLKDDVLYYHNRLRKMYTDLTQDVAVDERELYLRQNAPTLYDALKSLGAVLNDCPRTFSQSGNVPEIKLKIKPKATTG